MYPSVCYSLLTGKNCSSADRHRSVCCIVSTHKMRNTTSLILAGLLKTSCYYSAQAAIQEHLIVWKTVHHWNSQTWLWRFNLRFPSSTTAYCRVQICNIFSKFSWTKCLNAILLCVCIYSTSAPVMSPILYRLEARSVCSIAFLLSSKKLGKNLFQTLALHREPAFPNLQHTNAAASSITHKSEPVGSSCVCRRCMSHILN